TSPRSPPHSEDAARVERIPAVRVKADDTNVHAVIGSQIIKVGEDMERNKEGGQ
ncbi:hypothetical protein PAXRUDRAFT_143293, partial [Paxillus rubicundulus Ve08.2h10]